MALFCQAPVLPASAAQPVPCHRVFHRRIYHNALSKPLPNLHSSFTEKQVGFGKIMGEHSGATRRKNVIAKGKGECTEYKIRLTTHSRVLPSGVPMKLKNKVNLSTYADAIGPNLQSLSNFVDKHLDGAIGGVHLLPIYPSSGDGGFAPIQYDEVDPNVGTWEDVNNLVGKNNGKRRLDLTMEFMVNHISPESDQFQDYLEKGDDSEFSEMFVDWEQFWPHGRPTDDDLAKIRTRKPEAPVHTIKMHDGKEKKVWCTFSPQQIDINPWSDVGWQFVEESLLALCEKGADVIRVDAFGYATKKVGTRCFFEEPEAWELMEHLQGVVAPYDVHLLCEVHEDYNLNLKLAKQGYWVYDFALPLLVVHAFEYNTAENLKNWLKICPATQITVLDTHDGMGIDDIEGLADIVQVEEMKRVIKDVFGCGTTSKYHYNKQTKEYDSSDDQYNCTVYTAMREEDHVYLLARAIQFFTPGIPMVYYVGMLAGVSDKQLSEKFGSRYVNRHKYTFEEAEEQLSKPVVNALLDLCKFRNSHPAFNGEISINQNSAPHVLDVTWRNGSQTATLTANMERKSFDIFYTSTKDGSLKMVDFRAEDTYTCSPFTAQGGVAIAPEDIVEIKSAASIDRPAEAIVT